MRDGGGKKGLGGCDAGIETGMRMGGGGAGDAVGCGLGGAVLKELNRKGIRKRRNKNGMRKKQQGRTRQP